MKHNRYDLAPFEAALRGVDIIIEAPRATGRTTRLLDTLKDGDRFITPSTHQANQVRAILRDRGVENVEVVFFDPKKPWLRESNATSFGKTVFDHSFVEMYCKERIRDAMNNFATEADSLSGFDERHEATREHYRKNFVGRRFTRNREFDE